MKKYLCIFYSVMLLFTILAACTSSRENTVATDGSTSMEKVVGFLSESYMAENPGTKITFNPTGSAAGIRAAAESRCDIGLSSRKLTEDEEKTVNSTTVAIDGIAIVVNHENPVNDLSLESISKIYTGEISNWKDVGGTDSSIVPIGREAASGTRDGFESATDTEGICKYSQELTSTGDVIQTVASNPNAIGYASLASVKENVKTVSVDGINPSAETIREGEYGIRRDFSLVTKKDTPLDAAAQKFFDFATSSAADDLIIRAGAIPAKK